MQRAQVQQAQAELSIARQNQLQTVEQLYQRIQSVVLAPRDFVKTPTYFGPAPREIRNRQNIWQAKPGEKAAS